MNKINFVEALTERDVDLLLLEEIHCSNLFRDWFLKQIRIESTSKETFVGAWHSVIHPTLGETDIIIIFKNESGIRVAVLVENKIDAPQQEGQASRYHKRGRAGMTDGKWDTFHTCIVAPKLYLNRTVEASEYDSQVSYEAIRDWFLVKKPVSPRAQYRARLIKKAIEQDRRGYKPIPHEGVTKFWHKYWQLVTSEFTLLKMKKPGKVPVNSDWPILKSSELERGRRIIHKWKQGFVDLEIASAGSSTEEIKSANAIVLDNDMEVVQTGKSASVRIIVPKVDRFSEFERQQPKIRQCSIAVIRLIKRSSSIKWP